MVVRSGSEIFGDPHNAGKVHTNTHLARIAARTSVDIRGQLHLCDFEGVIEIFRVIENALAGIASDNLIVTADVLKDLRPDPDLANFTDLIAGCGHSDSAAGLADALVPRQQFGRYRGFKPFPFLQIGLQRTQIALVLFDELRSFRSEEHTSELQSRSDLVCRLLLEKKKK